MTEQLTLFNEEIFFDTRADSFKALETYNAVKSKGVIIGTDEAGRGALAGSVVAAAVTLTEEQESELIKLKLRDSKLLTPKRRENLFSAMNEMKVLWRVSMIQPDVIDRENILNASLNAMGQCVNKLSAKINPFCVIVDGNSRIKNINFPQWTLIKADKIIPTVSAASIIAKVIRDRLMKIYDKKYPVYDFAHNKGYPTKFHIEAIKKFGLSEIHRKTFCGKILKGDEKF